MARSIGPALALIFILVACAEERTNQERNVDDETAVQAVRAVNDAAPPIEEIVPEPLEMPEIEANDLIGLACSYSPGTSGVVRLIAREADAVLKIDGDLVRFAADPGSRKLPANSRTLYNGTEYSLRLDMGETPATDASGAKTYEGTMWLYDRWDRVVYTGTGSVGCGV